MSNAPIMIQTNTIMKWYPGDVASLWPNKGPTINVRGIKYFKS